MPIDPLTLVNRWFQAAEAESKGNHFDTEKRNDLFTYTEQTTNELKALQETKKEQAEKFADMILHSFDNHGVGESELLAQFIDYYKGKEGGKAYKSLHHLFETIADIKNYPNAFKDTFESSNVAWPLLSIIHIDSSAREYKGNILNNDVMDLVITNFVQEHPFKETSAFFRETSALRSTSKTMQIQVAHAYRGPLTDLRISTANQAIEYVEKYGKGLTYIDISKIAFSPDQLEELFQYLPTVNTLIARYCGIDKNGAEALARSENLKNIETLSLYANHLGNDGAVALVGSVYIEKLKMLELGSNDIDNKGAVNLANLKNLKKIKSLNLCNNEIMNLGAAAFARSKFLENIETLNLAKNKIYSDGVIVLARSKNLKNIKTLDLSFNLTKNRGAIALAGSKYLENIETLNLSNNLFGDRGAVALGSMNLKKIKTLDLDGNKIGNDTKEALRNRFGDILILP